MKIPAFWSKGVAEDTDRTGRQASLSCWRSSDRSQEDAQQSALAAAKERLRGILNGTRPDRYLYGETPLREETVEKFTGAAGDVVAVVTRNAHGCLVLNTARVMFIDLDFPPVFRRESLRYFFTRLFNKSAPSPLSRRESAITERLEQFLGGHPHWGLRLYRTCAGLRALVTHELFDPAADATLAVLQSVGADPLYVRLCKAQQCFRARLSPKPWRCGLRARPVRWPAQNPDQQARYEKWQAEYAARQIPYATCRFLGALGDGRVHPEVARIIEVHNKSSRCQEALDLA